MDDLTAEEALVMAMLLGFEWEEDNELFPLRWMPCSPSCTCNTYPCWGTYCICTREDAMWAFLLEKGVIEKIPEPKKP